MDRYASTIQDLESRIKRFYSQEISPLQKEVLESIENSATYGLANHKLKLLEELLRQPSNAKIENQLRSILALEKYDFLTLEKILEASSISPWENMANGETLIGFASLLAVIDQNSFQTNVIGNFDQNKKKIGEDRFFNFLDLIKKIWVKTRLQYPWQTCIEIIEKIAYCSNDTILTKNARPVEGEWDDPAEIYDRAIKIFLPEAEHRLWLKYCSKGQEGPDWLDRVRRKFYQGSQEAYGHWFQLSGKAVNEAVQAGLEWKKVNNVLGHYRAMAAYFFANIQVPFGKDPSSASKKKLEREKRLVSPVLFDTPSSDKDVTLIPVKTKPLGHYEEKIKRLVMEFEKAFKADFSKANLLGNGLKLEFEGREMLVFSRSEPDDFTYLIGCPVRISGEMVIPTRILYHWPKESFFHASDNQSVWIEKSHSIMFVHATGSDKEKIDSELNRLYSKLTSRNKIKQSDLEHDLARFFYLYFQRLQFLRGNAANGMILLNILLAMHHIPAPDAPEGHRFVDCEAMCVSEEDFRRGFWAWIKEEIFFP